MSTKYIGTNGYGEIQNLETSKERIKLLKTREFRNRLKLENIILGFIYYLIIKPAKAVKNFDLKNFTKGFTPKKAMCSFIAPAIAVMILLMTVGFWTDYVDFGHTAEKDSEELASVSNTAVLEQAKEITNDKSNGDVETNFTPVYQLSMMDGVPDNADELSPAFVSADSSLSQNIAGLYVNNNLIGVCSSAMELQSSLDSLLKDDIEHYDDETDVGFYNKVEVRSGIYNSKNIVSAKELIKYAQQKDLLKILVKTDIVLTETQPYSTKVKYDKSKESSYEKVTRAGKNGKQKTTYRVSYIDGVQVDAVITDVKTIKKAVNEVLVKGSQKGEAYSVSSTGFIWPVPSVHEISSPYGYREGGEFHTGLDIANGDCYGATIVASKSGTVEWAGYDDSGYGNYVIINHGDGYKTLYGHCSSVCVSQGQKVSQGQAVAAVGSTGQSTGNHCHFEVRTGDQRSDRQNPLNYVNQ